MDLMGVGIGPFNLSLAALLSKVNTIQSCFFDDKPEFAWHPGLMLPDSEITVGHFKDLVTLVDPTNPYSFLAYLVRHKRLYRFMNCDFTYVMRYEFNDYMKWVSQELGNLRFNEKVVEIDFKQNHFQLRTNQNCYQTKHIVLGSGLTPKIPANCEPFLGQHVFHSSNYLQHNPQKRIALIGGGQSAAEIVYHLLTKATPPDEIYWVSSRAMLFPMDNSAFSTEYFHPAHAAYFYQLPLNKRSRYLKEQLLPSDGISEKLLTQIYQRLYAMNLQGKKIGFRFIPHSKLTSIRRTKEEYQLSVTDHSFSVESVILCTGYQWKIPEYLEPIKSRISLESGNFRVNRDYSIQWDGPAQNRLYVQNGAQHSHGIADRNLSLMAFRSATIINSLTQKTIYDLANESAAIDWEYISEEQVDWRRASNG